MIEIKCIQFVLATEILNDNEKAKIAKVISMQTEGKEEVFQGYLTKEEQEQFIQIGEKIGIEKGEKIGIEKGEKIGIEKGEKKVKEREEEIAKTLIELGETPEYIEKVTNISKEQIAILTTTII